MIFKQGPWRVSYILPDGKRVDLSEGYLDEVGVQDWLHLEKLDNGVWWMKLGDASIQIEVTSDGIVTKLSIERDHFTVLPMENGGE